MHIIGRGRYAGETYPKTPRIAALDNRAVAVTPIDLTGFTPATAPLQTNIAARLFTPRSSGIFQILATLAMTNGAGADTYALGALLIQGTNLVIGGGESTSEGWRVGADTPVTVTGGVVTQVVANSVNPMLANAQQSFNISALTQPQEVGVPIAILLAVNEVAGGNAVTAAAILALSAYELP